MNFLIGILICILFDKKSLFKQKKFLCLLILTLKVKDRFVLESPLLKIPTQTVYELPRNPV
jgi:hypothetical protein